MGQLSNVIRGRVFVKGTGAGISDLVVVAYDLDVKTCGQLARRERLPRDLWGQLGSDRIGSALTDADGRFELEYGDEAAHEQRPDIIAFVLAPEEPESGEAPRVLHASLVPRTDAGRREALSVALPQRRLLPPAPPPPTPEQNQFHALLTPDPETKAQIRTALDVRSLAAVKAKGESREKSMSAVNRFLLPKITDVPGLIFVPPGADVAAVQKESFDKGLSAIGEKDAPREMSISMPIQIADDWMERTGGRGAPLKDLLDEVHRITGGGALERSQSAPWDCAVSHEVDRRMSCTDDGATTSPTNGTTTPTNGDNGTPTLAPHLTTDALLDEHLSRQLANATSPETELTYGVPRDGEIDRRINAFRLTGGPADTQAFHDFHEIKINFDPLWTSILDDDLRNMAREVYEEILVYKNRVSGVTGSSTDFPWLRFLFPENTEPGELEKLLDDFSWFLDSQQAAEMVPAAVLALLRTLAPPLSNKEWSRFDEATKERLVQLAAIRVSPSVSSGSGGYDSELHQWRTVDDIEAEAATLVARARSVLQDEDSQPRFDRLRDLLKKIDQRLRQRYRFDVFAENSLNFGLLLTYRQTWDPLDYQVGRLVSTVPLAPKEQRKYTVKKTLAKKRIQKELDDSERKSNEERSDTSRAESEIVKSARNSTSFSLQTQGQVSVGVFEGGMSSNVGVNSETSSQNTKRNLREATRKAAEEYRQQSRLEVELNVDEGQETVTENQISNPNEEITVTYLFYELQRQYRIREQLQRVEPVILVANEVPNPDEIDQDWLMANGWILRRVLLDRSLEPVLDHLDGSFVGEELALEVLKQNVERQARVVDELGAEQKSKREIAEKAFNRLDDLVNRSSLDPNAADVAKAMAMGPLFFLGGMFGNDGSSERREDVAKMAVERADREVQEVTARISREMAALQQAVDKYVDAIRHHFDWMTKLARLQIHVKENILYYMQAIWDHEPTDQRFFRLYNIDVPWILPPEEVIVELSPAPDPGRPGVGMTPGTPGLDPGHRRFTGQLRLDLPMRKQTRKLYEVADIDRLLGYKGNYMIFRLRESSYLNDYMMQEYVDFDTRGLRDPDRLSNLTADELTKYACCLKTEDPQRYDREKDQIRQLLTERLADPRGESDIVVVPSDQLFIEALPGQHPLLEDFKLVHRALDVKKVQAEVRAAEIENLRLASRLLEKRLEDPNIEKVVNVQGQATIEAET